MVPALTKVDPKLVAEELAARIGEEIDYLVEAANQSEFARIYRGHPFIHVPEVVDELCSAHVLTSELSTGRRWQDALEADQPLRNSWGETIHRFFYGTIRRHGMFNADPHPGNYLFHDDGTVTFVDFGCVKRFTPDAVAGFWAVADATLAGDADALRDVFTELGMLDTIDAPSAEEILAWYAPTFEPLTAPQPYTFTPEFAAGTVRTLFNPFGGGPLVNRAFRVPRDFVTVYRIYVGMNSVLGALRATSDWRAIHREYFGGPPAPGLGQLDHEFLSGGDKGRP